MIKVDYIHHIPQIKNISSIVTKPIETVTEHAAISTAELSRKTSEAVTSAQKALLSLKERPRLNLDSEAVKFFGLRSYEDMINSMEWTFTDLYVNKLGCQNFNRPEIIVNNFNRCQSSLVSLFEGLNPNYGCARMTFGDKCLGRGLHTIGFVRNKDTLYVMDSLGHNADASQGIRNFHTILTMLLSINKQQYGLKNIIMNCIRQQSCDEITCNHWTFANIESLIKALKSGKIIEDSTSLDRVLPYDINKVLNEQMDFVLNKTCSI